MLLADGTFGLRMWWGRWLRKRIIPPHKTDVAATGLFIKEIWKHDATARLACLIVKLFALLASRVLGANMGCKRLVALQLKVPHHFIKGIARG